MAKKHKYAFDIHTLSVKQVRVTAKDHLRKWGGYLAIGIAFFGAALFFSFYFLDTPKERQLRRELDSYNRQYKQLEKRVDQLTTVLSDVQGRDQDLYRMIFEAEPPKSAMRTPDLHEYEAIREHVSDGDVYRTTEKINNLYKDLYKQSKSFDEIYKLVKNKNAMMAAMPAILPVNKKSVRLVSGFGMRLHPIFRMFRMHTGIDFAGPKGTPVYATGDGVVRSSGDLKGYSGYGISVLINHGFGYQTLYAHLSKTAVLPGKKVKRGDLIGYIGSTGTSTGTHLHYEVILNGRQVNPIYYFFNDLSPDEYEEAIRQASEINQSLS